MGLPLFIHADGTQYADIPEQIWLAPLFIGLAALVDFLDGFLARLLKQSRPAWEANWIPWQMW